MTAPYQIPAGRLLKFLSMLLLSQAAWAVPKGIGLQAFNWKFTEIAERMPELSARGYTHVQVSPPQKSLDRPEWFYRYQPMDYRSIEGPLGSESEFRAMTETAKKHGIQIVVDVVLNHMAGAGHVPSLEFPQFGPKNFHFPDTRPCIKNWNDRYEVTHFWLCYNKPPGLSDLDTSQAHVRDVHRQYLEKLISLGASGFRVDAAKHIETPYFAEVLKGLPAWTYGGVIGSNFTESQEYFPLMDVTDFHLLGGMLEIFNSAQPDLRKLPILKRLQPSKAVVFARNHDTAMGQDFFRFHDPKDIPLGYAYILGTGEGFPMVFSGDFRDPSIQAGIAFFRTMQGKPAKRNRGACAGCDHPKLLFIERGNSGLVIINASGEWFKSAEARFPALKPGCYRELTYGFFMELSPAGQVTRWADPGKTGIELGSKTALYFAPAPAIQCRR